MCNGFGQKDENFAKKVKQLRKIPSYNIEKKAWRENEKSIMYNSKEVYAHQTMCQQGIIYEHY